MERVPTQSESINTLRKIRENIFSVISLEPEIESTENQLVYIAEMNGEELTNGGLWSSSLRRALTEGLVEIESIDLAELDIDEMTERELQLVTHPKTEKIYRHIITLSA
jgi:hypothetical protein